MAQDSAAGFPDVSLTLNALSHRFGRRAIFSEVGGSVRSGGVLVIAGPNGSGKSTLLRIIAGLLQPTGGTAEIAIRGARLDRVERRSCLGYVAPDLTLYRELTGAENLQLFGRLRGSIPSREELGSLLERVGLKGRGRDYVANYSSGMRQRLKFAFALLHRPPILVLDEPTANLDSEGVAMARAIVDEQRNRGLTVIATNEVSELAWGDHVVTLSAG